MNRSMALSEKSSGIFDVLGNTNSRDSFNQENELFNSNLQILKKRLRKLSISPDEKPD